MLEEKVVFVIASVFSMQSFVGRVVGPGGLRTEEKV